MLEFSRSLYLCNHLPESIHSWTKGTLPYPTLLAYPTHMPTLPFTSPSPTLHYPALPLPYPYPTYPTLTPTPPHPTLPCLTLPHPYPHLTPYPTLPLPLPYHLRIHTHAHNQASHSRAMLSCDSSSYRCSWCCAVWQP